MDHKWMVEAVYNLGDVDEGRDKKLYKAVGRYSDGSGYGFGGRDHAWYYKRKDAAEAALKRIRAAKIGGVKATLRSMD